MDNLEDFKNYIWISNYQINKQANLKIEDFLQKIRFLKNLRLIETGHFFYFYPTSKKEYEENIRLWDFINNDKNALNDSHKVFIAGFPLELYYFLRHTPKKSIFTPIILALAGIYILEVSKRKIMEENIYRPLFDEIIKVVNKHFKQFINLMDDEKPKKGIFSIQRQKFEDIYNTTYGSIVKNSILFSLINPFNDSYKVNTILDDDLGINIPLGYLSDIDWEAIVMNGKEDPLIRSESNEILLKRWRLDLIKYHKEEDF